MYHTMENSQICIECHECCKWMTFILKPDSTELTNKYIEFYQTRGCDYWLHHDGVLSIMVPYRCPELLESGRCDAYSDRPQQCRDYDGRWDPHMRDKCKLPRGEYGHMPEDKTMLDQFAAQAEEDPDVIQVSTPMGPNRLAQCPFCGVLDPGELICSKCGKHMVPPEEDGNGKA
jgi:Fe-S-cluster containining protein